MPLEVVFKPDVRGQYDPGKAEIIGADGEPYNILKEGFVATYFRFNFKTIDGGPDLRVENPWRLRQEVMDDDQADDRDEKDWQLYGITYVYGRFGDDADDLLVPYTKLNERCVIEDAKRALTNEYMEWIALIRVAMATPMERWKMLTLQFPADKVARLCKPLPLAIEWRDGRPAGVIACTGVLQALIATVHVDALIGAQYRFCACVGCKKSFKVKRKQMRYCSELCKHRQLTRDGRDRKRMARQQTKDVGERGKTK